MLKAGYIGLDVGTTGVRALLVREDGAVAGIEEEAHQTFFPKPGWAEQDPSSWVEGAFAVLGRLAGRARMAGLEVRSLGLTGQMHGATFLGADDQPLRPAIIWMDQRTQHEAQWLDAELRARSLRQMTRNPALPNMTATKVLWLTTHEPRIRERVRALLLPKDYVRLALTGEKATDVSDASGTLFLDVPKRAWSEPVVRLVGMEMDELPRVYESCETTGTLSRRAAERTGLPFHLPVVAGAGDQAAGAVGVGVSGSDCLMVSLGTSGVVFGATRQAPEPTNESLHAFCHAVPGLWHWMGVTQAAGGSLKWFRETVAPGASYEELDQESSLVSRGSEGLLFLPYLMGERAPILDPRAKGLFMGLTARHTRGHLARAVMEGVAYSLRDVTDAASTDFATQYPVRVIGGGATSGLWRAILAATLDRPVECVHSPEGAAFGAALLAADGVNGQQPVTRTWVKVSHDPLPDPEWTRWYGEGIGQYRAVYGALRDLMHNLP